MTAARMPARLVGAVVLVGLLGACQGAGSDSDTPSTPAGPSAQDATPSASPSATAPTPSPAASPAGDITTAGTTVLLSPAPGAVVDGPTVTVSGEATAFEGTLVWDVVPAGAGEDAAPVAEGSTQAGANGEVGPFTIAVDLEPGTWTVRVWEPDMSDGEGEEADASGRRNLVTVTITVR